MTHHVVYESFKNNISNNTHNIAQGDHPVFRGANAPSHPLKCNPGINIEYFLVCQLVITVWITELAMGVK